MDFTTKFAKDWDADTMAAFITELKQNLDMAINGYHAPIMIPRTTIDASHPVINGLGAAFWTAQHWTNTFGTTSNAIQTALNYVGRGVLRLCVLTEMTSGTTTAYNAELKITIDGTVVYDDAASVNRETQARIVVGQYVETTNSMALDDPIGLPFNQSCKIEIKSDGTRTTNVGWRVSKKL